MWFEGGRSPHCNVGGDIQRDGFIGVHREQDIIADRVTHMAHPVSIALRSFRRDAHQDLQTFVAFGDQTSRHLDQLISVIGTEAKGDINIGMVVVVAEKLGDSAAGGLADQISKSEVQTAECSKIDPGHVASLGDQRHQP